MLISWSALAMAQSYDELINDGKNTENVLSFGMSRKLQMYSPLNQINKSNVKRLVPIWATNTMSETGELAQDRKSTRLNSSHIPLSRMPSSA